MKLIKNKGAGWYLSIFVGLVTLVLSIILFATQAHAMPNGVSGVSTAVIFLVSAVVSMALAVFPIRLTPLIQVILNTIGLAFLINQIYTVFADIANHIKFSGADPTLCMTYLGLAIIVSVLPAVACWFAQTKDSSELI